ncbi:unnamed protein product, partial [marine sediment metagenome]
ERERISNLAKDIYNRLLLFAREEITVPVLEYEGDVEPFTLAVRQILSRKKSDYTGDVNDKVKSLGIQTEEFNTREMDSLLCQLAEMEKGIPQYSSTWTDLTRQKRNEWENNDAEYADLAYVPAVVEGLNRTLDTILINAFDELQAIFAHFNTGIY